MQDSCSHAVSILMVERVKEISKQIVAVSDGCDKQWKKGMLENNSVCGWVCMCVFM